MWGPTAAAQTSASLAVLWVVQVVVIVAVGGGVCKVAAQVAVLRSPLEKCNLSSLIAMRSCSSASSSKISRSSCVGCLQIYGSINSLAAVSVLHFLSDAANHLTLCNWLTCLKLLHAHSAAISQPPCFC